MHKGCTSDYHARRTGPPIEEQWRRKRRVFDDHQAGATVKLRSESGVPEGSPGVKPKPDLPDALIFGVSKAVGPCSYVTKLSLCFWWVGLKSKA